MLQLMLCWCIRNVCITSLYMHPFGWLLLGVMTRSFHAAEVVLEELRDQFIGDVEADVVVYELQNKGIIPQGVQARIAAKHSRREKNQILHQHLVETSTKESLIMACGIIIAEAENGYPKMKVLGEAMKKMMEPGKNLEI